MVQTSSRGNTMDLIKTITSKACYFLIHTGFRENDYLTQEYSLGLNGLLMHYPAQHDGVNNYYKFLIHPDPDHDGEYRMIMVGYPDYSVQFESDRARITPQDDNGYQRFIFNKAPTPEKFSDQDAHWYYIKSAEMKLNMGFASHGYVFAFNETHDETKFRFEPVDVIEPIAELIIPASKTTEPSKPPKNMCATDGDEVGMVLVSQEAIPSAMINDENYNNKVDQLKMNPYYYLKYEKLWSAANTPIISLSKRRKTVRKVEYVSAFSSSDFQSIENTVGHSFSASIEASASMSSSDSDVQTLDDLVNTDKDKLTVSGSIKLAYQYQNQTKTLSEQQKSKSENLKTVIEDEYRELGDEEPDIQLRFWVSVDRYTLLDHTGKKVVKQWDHIVPDRIVPQEIDLRA